MDISILKKLKSLRGDVILNRYIVFDKTVTNYYFYETILMKYLSIYKENKYEPPILDLRKVSYIDVAAVSVLLSFGDYLRKVYHQKIEMLIEHESEILNFLFYTKFIEISDELEIFKIDDETRSSWKINPLRSLHKITFTRTEYSDVNKIEDLLQRRDFIFDNLLDSDRVMYRTIFEDLEKLPDSVIDTTLNSIAEIKTNAIMYSKSYSFTYIATDRFGTKASISDSGIGFEKSFVNDKKALEMNHLFADYDSKFHNFLIIMSALNYSYKKHVNDKRKDLWTLKTEIVQNNGILRIHYKNTLVIFSFKRCKKCEIKLEGDIAPCVRCLYNDFTNDQYSPVKLFDVSLQGVRIEFSVSRG